MCGDHPHRSSLVCSLWSDCPLLNMQSTETPSILPFSCRICGGNMRPIAFLGKLGTCNQPVNTALSNLLHVFSGDSARRWAGCERSQKRTLCTTSVGVRGVNLIEAAPLPSRWFCCDTRGRWHVGVVTSGSIPVSKLNHRRVYFCVLDCQCQ